MNGWIRENIKAIKAEWAKAGVWDRITIVIAFGGLPFAIPFIISFITFFLPDNSQLAKSLQNFASSDLSTLSVPEALDVPVNSYEKVCIFLDADSYPGSAKEFLRDFFKDQTIDVKREYGAIVALISKDSHDIIFLKKNRFYAKGESYFLRSDDKLNGQVQGCALFNRAIFKKIKTRFQYEIQLSSQEQE